VNRNHKLSVKSHLEVQFVFAVTKFSDKECKKLSKNYCDNCSFKLGL